MHTNATTTPLRRLTLTRHRRPLALIAPLALLALASCNPGPQIDRGITAAQDAVNASVATLNGAIDALDRNSSSWQSVLQDTTSKLTLDAQSLLRTEVTNLLTASVAVTGAELRCDTDFIGTRVRQTLIRLRDALLNRAVPPAEPVLCHVDPAAIDMALDPSRRNKLDFFGYDFDTTPIKVSLQDRTRTLDVSSSLNHTTHYQMTLNLGSNGVPLSGESNHLLLEWQQQQISSVAVIQPATPVCKEKPDTYARDVTLSYTPPHTRGDAEFAGHGPEVWSIARWINYGTHVNVRLWMKAQETTNDWTTAEGVREEPYYTAPSGWRIESVASSGSESTAHYVDTNNADDYLGGGPNGPVKEFAFRGDGPGDDAGSFTGVTVTFNPLIVNLVEVGNCASAKAIHSLKLKGLLAPSTANRLKAEIMKFHPVLP